MARYDMTCADCGKPMARGPRSRAQGQARCHTCRRTSGGNCTVDGCDRKSAALGLCVGHYRRQRKGQSFGTPLAPRGPSRNRACEVCATDFIAKEPGQRTCSRACGVKINSRVQASRQRTRFSAVRWSKCRDCGRPFTIRGGRRCPCIRVIRPPDFRLLQPCLDCGAVLELHRHNLRRLRCDRCLAQQRRRDKDKRRALKRAAYVSDVYRAQIYTRDGNRCQLCGKKMNMKVVAPHPMAPTLDHIIPLACGGTHEPANVHAAHFICNTRKSHGGGGEQLLLIG